MRSLLLAGLAAVAVLPAAAAAQASGGPLEEGFFELRIERIPGRIPLSTRVDSAGRVLIPVDVVARHAGIPVTHHPDGLELEWPSGEWSTRFVTSTGRVVAAQDSIDLAPDDGVTVDGRPFVRAEVLTRVLGASVTVDWPTLTVVVARNDDFPVIRQAEVRLARAAVPTLPAERRVDTPYGLRTAPGAVGWGVSFLDTDAGVLGTGRGTLGLAFLGGALETGATLTLDERGEADTGDGFVRYTRVFPENPVVRQLGLGHVVAGGVLPRRLAGGTLSNRPESYHRRFGEVALAPAIPDGWEAEVYRGRHLVGVSRGGQGAGLSTPLDYGDTPVRIRMLGPAGQEVVQEVVYSVPAGRVPPGRWWYDVGGGRCLDPEPCESFVFAELAHGLTRWATVSAGAERLEDEVAARWRPHGSLSLSPLPNLTAEARLLGDDYVRGSLSLATVASGALTATYARQRKGAGIAPGLDGWFAGLSASGPLVGRRWASARFDLRGREDGRVDFWQARISTVFGSTLVAVEHEEGLGPSPLTALRLHRPLLAAARGPIRDLTVGVAGGASAGRIALAEATLSARPGSAGVLGASVEWRRDLDPLVTLSWSVRAPFGFLQAREVQGRHRSRFVSADGGVAFGSGTMMALPHGAVGRSGLDVDIFLDVDGDGRRDVGEPGAADARIDVGGRSARADERGRARTWDLRPYEAVEVTVDPLSLELGWAAPTDPISVRPAPNGFTRVGIPLRPTREVMGRVTTEDGGVSRPLGQALVHVTDGSGTPRASVRTFHDGVFYLEALSPGTYGLALDAAVARALDLEVRVVPFTVPATGEGPLELPDLVVRPVGQPVSDGPGGAS